MIIEYSDNFLKEAKELNKKYKLLKEDLKTAVDELKNGDLGTPLGANLYKKRVKNSSIPTGKSGGYRVIIYQEIASKLILISIYSKREKDSLSDLELEDILQNYFKQASL